MKKHLASLIVVSLLFTQFQNAQVPGISNFTPAVGIPGTSVTINGSNFSTVVANNVVWLGAVKCNVTAATATQLTVTVLTHASHDFFLYTNTSSNLSCYSFKKFLVGFNNALGYSYNAASFPAAVSFTIGLINSEALGRKYSVSDIDDDGKPDIVVFTGNNNTTKSIYYLRNTATAGTIGAGSFATTTGSPNTPVNSNYYGHTVATDLNSDGKLDYIGAVLGLPSSGTANGSSFYKNTSTAGTPSLNLEGAVPYYHTYMPSPFDINKDGKIDVLSYSPLGSRSRYYWENTNTAPANALSFSFIDIATPVAGGYPDWTTGREADLDGDGLVDAVMGGSSKIYTYRNTTATDAAAASFSFTLSTAYAISNSGPVDFRITDLDGDGKDDVITASANSSMLNIFPNQSVSGTIMLGTKVDINLSAGNIRGIATGDLNNDGKPDILISGANFLTYLQNTSTGTGNFTFASPVSFGNAGNNLSSLELIDMDGDTRLDIVGYRDLDNTIKVVRNTIGELAKFYSTSSGSTFTNLFNWTTASNGVGGTAPTDFGSNKEFILANRASYNLNGTMTIAGKLNLNGNKMNLGNFDLTVGSISDGGAASYVATNGTGKFKMSITDAGSVTIPVGNTAYNPVTITNNSGAADVFSTQVLDEVYVNGASGTTVNYARVRRTWDISKTNANGGSGVNLVFNWNTGETTSVFSSPTMCHYEGGSWVSKTGTTSTGATSLSYTGYTESFSPFSVMNMGTTLPLLWINFSTALQADNTVRLQWSTGDEMNVSDFDAEWSTDGITFKSFAKVKALNQALNNYSATHAPATNGKIYYRIKQTDIDGRFTYSFVKMVAISAVAGIKIYPNPADTRFTISFMNVNINKAIVSVSNINGQEIFRKIIAGDDTQKISIATSNWIPGLYNVKILNADGSTLFTERISKR